MVILCHWYRDRNKTVQFILKGHNPSSMPVKVLWGLGLQAFLMTTAICLFLKVITEEGEVYYLSPFTTVAVPWAANWHPVLYPGVHAEARPVPAEHLSSPIPAAAPQEGPHAAQVHRGRNVRAVSNLTLIQITKRIIGWQLTATLALTLPAPQKKIKSKSKYQSWQSTNPLASFLFFCALCTVATDLALIVTSPLGPPSGTQPEIPLSLVVSGAWWNTFPELGVILVRSLFSSIW